MNSYRYLILHFAFCTFCLAFALCASAADDQAPEATFYEQIQPLLQNHCFACHGADEQNGNLRLDQLTADFSSRENAAIWIEVRDKINLGEMPPEGEPQLPTEQIQTVSRWVSDGLRQAQRAQISSGDRVLLRRMNRHEYTHTVADLFAMEFPTGESPLDVLPPDGTAEGFDKVSAALLLDPSLMELYYRVVRQIVDRAIVDGPPEFPTKTMRLEFEDIAQSRAISYLITKLGMEPVDGGLRLIEGATRSFGMIGYDSDKGDSVNPINGFYRFTVRAGAAQGSDGEVPQILLTQNHPDEKQEPILEVVVTAAWDKPEDYSVIVPRDTLGKELNVQLTNPTRLYMGQLPGEHFMQRNNERGKQGEYEEVLRLAGRQVAEGAGGDRSTPDPDKLDVSQYPRVFLDYGDAGLLHDRVV